MTDNGTAAIGKPRSLVVTESSFATRVDEGEHQTKSIALHRQRRVLLLSKVGVGTRTNRELRESWHQTTRTTWERKVSYEKALVRLVRFSKKEGNTASLSISYKDAPRGNHRQVTSQQSQPRTLTLPIEPGHATLHHNTHDNHTTTSLANSFRHRSRHCTESHPEVSFALL